MGQRRNINFSFGFA